MKTDDFDYVLPPELVAQTPAEPRDSCRLLVLDRNTGTLEHRHFSDIGDYLEPGDLLVANETRVMPARLLGRKRPSGVESELLLIRAAASTGPGGVVWECLARPGRRLKPGAVVEFYAGGADGADDSPVVLVGEVLSYVAGSRGGRNVRLVAQDGLSLDEAIHLAGAVPLPPYIRGYRGNPELYQTVYAMRAEHSAAAPTAGLHFTPGLISSLERAGVGWKTVELEVGIDTFRLIEEDDPTTHVMHTERYHVGQDVIDAIHETKAAGHRVIAVGTTSVRSLESAFEAGAPVWNPPCVARGFEQVPDSAAVLRAGDVVARQDATTNLFLMPGSTFHVTDAMITNFHVPRSTLMMLVSAFAGRERILAAYEEAIRERYRFFSFGDAMLLI